MLHPLSVSRLLIALLSLTAVAVSHPVTFNSTITYSSTQPTGGAASVANWTGAAFDAANLGGSGVNADGGANNGVANDATTYVANNQPVQGQTIRTGSNVNGYDLTSITVRMAGYTNNVASGSNRTAWNLNAQNGPIIVTLGKVNGTTLSLHSMQNFIAGGIGSPGAGTSSNGPGTYITFNLPVPVHLEPDTNYGFDFIIGNGGANYFEWLGTSTDPFPDGTAYTRGGLTLTPRTGDRVFMLNLTASAAPPPVFVHPGTLHTPSDLARITAKVAANAQPWKADYDILVASPYAQTSWPAYNVDYINRGGANPNNYTRSQQDAQAIYELALRWHITGNTAYADRAVQITNVWSGLLGVTGDSNQSLAAGICGYLFAIAGDLLSTYPGWPAVEKQAFKDMMMRVFYPANFDFLWRKHDTFWREGGNTHYRLNWETCNMASMAAIGVLCDNRVVYQQALDYFKTGAGNGRIERAAWFIHPNGLGQGEEAGRDQGHNLGGWDSMARLCQIAWSQGDDLYGYDNNRVLRALEYNAKYNLGYDVPYTRHRNTMLSYTEGAVSGAGRGNFVPLYEQIYNHYVNIKGLAAPYSKVVAEQLRPEDRPHTEYHPSQVDWFGLGTLTFTLDPIATGAVPSGLVGHWSKSQIALNWWGSAYATSYSVKRATTSGGPYTMIGTTGELDTTFTDTNVANGTIWYYVISAVTPSGETANSAEFAVTQSLVTRYTFENTLDDIVGTRHGAAMGGSTGGPTFAAGKVGQAVSLDGVDDFVQFPVGSGNYQDITIAAWVYWNGGGNWQRVFDFGSEIEHYLMLTPKSASNTLRFQMTTTRANDGTLTLDGPVMPTTTWTHVAVTLNGDTATLYVNGVPVDSDTALLVDPLFGQPYCYLGRSMWNGDPLFSGRIDDFRIYNHALSGSDVYALWGQSTNSAPAFTSDPLTKPNATEDAAYIGQTLAGTATDANGGTLTFSKVTGPSWLSVASNGTLSGTPINADVGSNLFVVRVADSTGATDDANLYITVANTNDAPVWAVNPLTKREVTRDQPYLAVTLAGDASDADAGDSFSFSKVGGPAWLSIASDGTLSGTPDGSDVGANAFMVRVTDVAGAFTDATLNITVLPFMLRSQYAFEGDVNDGIGALHGIATGSPLYAAGRFAQGIAFDGTDDVVTLPDGVAGYHDITIAAFVWWNGGATTQRVFDFGDSTTEFLYLRPNSSTGLRFAIQNGATNQQLNAAALPTGRWVHVAVTLGGDTGTLYVNGVAVATNNAMTHNPGDFRPSNNLLGDSQTATDALFDGKLDDFRIYNYALAAADVFEIANPIPEVPSGLDATGLQAKVALSWNPAQAALTYTVKRSPTSGGPYSPIASSLTATNYTDTGLANGVTYFYVASATNAKGESADSPEIAGTPSDLLVHLKFNESDGTSAADSSGNDYDATLLGAPAFVAGQLGNAINFASASSQFATLPNGIVSTLGDFTITAWVKPASFATWARVFDFGTGTNNYMFLTTQYTSTSPNGAKPRFAIRTAAVSEQGINSSTALTAGTWNHIAITLSGNTATMYVNGAVAGMNTGVTLRPSSLGVTTQNYLAESQWSGDPFLNGSLDDFRIYSRALSASEISVFQTPLTAPQNLTATPRPAQIALTWDAVGGATSYLVKTATTSGGPYTTLATVTGTAFAHTGLPMSPRYYVVAAQNLTGPGPDSAEASATAESPAFTELELRGGTLAVTDGGTTLTMAMPQSVVGHTYQLQFAADLATGLWEDIGISQSGTGNDLLFTLPHPNTASGFLRFIMTR